LLIAGVGSNLIQHRLVFSTDPLTPKFSKISPAAGFARLFGKQAGANFLKGIFKVLLVGVVMCTRAVARAPSSRRDDPVRSDVAPECHRRSRSS
jgi:flagellar biosynthesis protein FlhB